MKQMPTVLEQWVAPWQRTNQFMVERMEQWAALQMESLKAYVDLGVAQIKVALKVNNPNSLQEFTDSQFAVLSFVGHRMLDDNRLLAEWSAAGYRQADRVARQNLLGLLLK